MKRPVIESTAGAVQTDRPVESPARWGARGVCNRSFSGDRDVPPPGTAAGAERFRTHTAGEKVRVAQWQTRLTQCWFVRNLST